MSHKRRLQSSSEEDDGLLREVEYELQTDMEGIDSGVSSTVTISATAEIPLTTIRSVQLVGMDAYASSDEGDSIRVTTTPVAIPLAGPLEQLAVVSANSVVTPKQKKVKRSKKAKVTDKNKKSKTTKKAPTEPVPAICTALQPRVNLEPLPVPIRRLPSIPKVSKPTPTVRPKPGVDPDLFPSTFISASVQAQLDRVQQDYKLTKCSYCYEGFASHGLLCRHVRRAHTLVMVCECGYRSRSRDNVTRHQRIKGRHLMRGHNRLSVVSIDQEEAFIKDYCRPAKDAPVTRTIINDGGYNPKPSCTEIDDLKRRVQQLEDALAKIKRAFR